MNLKLPLITSMLFVLCACTQSKLMLQSSMMPGHDKVVREAIKNVGQTKKETLNNYYLQVCDIEAGVPSNCRTTLVLENIINYDIDTRRLP